MTANIVTGASRRSAVLAAVAGLHVGAFILSAGGMLPRLLEALPAPPPDVVIPRIVAESPTLDATPVPGASTANGGSGGQGTLQPPALQLRDSRLAALIDACYPSRSRRMGEEGRTVARIVVNTDGRAASSALAQGSGFQRLDAAIGCVIPRLHFHPGRRDGTAIVVEVQLPIVFQLR